MESEADHIGMNTGYAQMEKEVVALYDKGVLTRELLDKIMDPYKESDCDSGESKNLRSKDGLGIEEIICKTMKPEEYKDVTENPEYYVGEPETWQSNKKAYDLFSSIWYGMWGIW